MQRCLRCGGTFKSNGWSCPTCSWQPQLIDGFPSFAPEIASANEGFKAEYFDRLAASEEGYFWFESRNQLLTWALAKYFPDAKSFFEVGCGTGFVLRGIREKFPEICLVGGEVFTNGLRSAAKRLSGVELIQVDASAMPYQEEFDVVGAFDVLEHIDGDESVLSGIYQAVRSGGGLMLTVPQHKFLWSAADDHAHHKRRYSRSELVKKVQDAGFKILMTTSFVSLLVPALLIARRGRGQREGYSVFKEFEIGKTTNRLLATIMGLERAAIRIGVRFPIGGSLLLIAQK